MASNLDVHEVAGAKAPGRPLGPLWQIALWVVIGIPLVDIGSQLVMFVTGLEVPHGVIVALSWVLAAILAWWIVSELRGAILLKVFLALTLVKWATYILFLKDLHFRKDILLMIPLMLVVIEKEEFRERLIALLSKYRYVFAVLVALTFVPFMGEYRTTGAGTGVGGGMYRVTGLWANSKYVGWYFIALMMMVPRRRVLVITVFYLLVVYCGARSAMLAGATYFVYVCVWQVAGPSGHEAKGKAMLILMLLVLGIGSLGFSGKLDYVILSAESNLRPLVEVDITSDGYGSARILLNRIALEEIVYFDAVDLLLGRSATMMGDLYEKEINARSWPHNDFVTALFCHGLLGLLFYVFYLFVYPWRRYNGRERARVFSIQVAIFILAASSGFYNYSASYLFVAWYGGICGTDWRTRRDL